MTERLDFGEERFRCILADPPWKEQGGGKIKRGADRHYGLMKTADIPGVMKGAKDPSGSPLWRPAGDSILWLWVTNNFLRDGLWVMEELGFRYVTNAVWVKPRMGIGQYLRGMHELLLLGVRGRGLALACTDRRDLTSAIVAPVPTENGKRVHSRKPEAAYELIEARTMGPRLELFGRRPREGWTVWGNEIPGETS